MPNARVPFPCSFSNEKLMRFLLELDYYTEHDRLIFELPERLFFPPFAMLAISSKIYHLKRRRPNLTVVFDGWEKHSYLSHMGFFQMCGFDHGNEVGAASGSRTYLPISELSRNDVYSEGAGTYEEFGDLIQKRSERISEILTQDVVGKNKNSMFDVLSYSIREIFRNVFEHSQADSLYFCVQYWPNSEKVEFAVADFGVGIRRGLSENPNFNFPTDKQALEYSLLPSVSGKTHLPRLSDTWHNSGYGLYMTNRMARNGGNFAIMSGEYSIFLTRKTKTNIATSFPGTAIRLNLSIGEIGNVQSRLSEFREDGSKLAAQIKGGSNRPPSAMSLLLRSDYQRRSFRS